MTTGHPGETNATGVAVYIDFDNIVISRYDQLHGRGHFHKDRHAGFDKAELAAATVDLHAILDFASSFGTITLARAYADWSEPVNAAYRKQLVDRAVDLVQLFPASGSKNGADIRLAVDAVEDAARMPAVSHVVIVAGDSDYIPLAQRLKRLGRYVVAVGIAGATSRALAAACDELDMYDTLPGVAVPEPVTEPEPAETAEPDEHQLAARLLERALRLGHEKDDDATWLFLSSVKQQMRRMDPSFSEKELGFRSFTDFVKAHPSVAALDESTQTRMVRLR